MYEYQSQKGVKISVFRKKYLKQGIGTTGGQGQTSKIREGGAVARGGGPQPPKY